MSGNRFRQRLCALFCISTILLIMSFVIAGAAEARTLREWKIHHAMKIVAAQAGDPYVYGADGPDAFDCSGLTKYSFGHAGLYLPRSADEQSNFVRRIPRRNAVRGDFVFYHDYSGHVFHVAVIAGRTSPHGRRLIWHAPYPGKDVERDLFWQHAWYAGTLRIKR